MTEFERVAGDEQWVRDAQGQVIGTTRDTLVDAQTGRPVWLLVESGVAHGLPSRMTAVPAQEARRDEHGVRVPFARALVEGAPPFDPNAFYGEALLTHYGLTATPDETVAEVVRSEEEVTVRTVAQPHERVRLRKEVVTEQVHVTVTVRREVLHVERVDLEPPELLMAGQPLAHARELADGEHVIELYGEVPVIGTHVVPIERVHLRTDVVTEPSTVTGPRRVERVEVERHPAAPGAP